MKRPATVQAKLVCVGLTLLPYGVTGHLALSNLVGTRTYGSDLRRSSEQVIRPTRSVPTERSGDAPQPNNDDEPRSRDVRLPGSSVSPRRMILVWRFTNDDSCRAAWSYRPMIMSQNSAFLGALVVCIVLAWIAIEVLSLDGAVDAAGVWTTESSDARAKKTTFDDGPTVMSSI